MLTIKELLENIFECGAIWNDVNATEGERLLARNKANDLMEKIKQDNQNEWDSGYSVGYEEGYSQGHDDGTEFKDKRESKINLRR